MPDNKSQCIFMAVPEKKPVCIEHSPDVLIMIIFTDSGKFGIVIGCPPELQKFIEIVYLCFW